jgi:GNAT superfamily N-acetyltransferase
MMSNSYTLIEVTDRKTKKDFHELPVRLKRDDDNWIRPLNNDIEKIFDPDQNKSFRKGNAIRWLLKNKSNKVIGRIAAFYDTTSAKKNDQPTGGVGFFECINDEDAANCLFDAAREWLKSNGMEAMDGPINFGDRDHFWGCLSEGFYPPLYNMPYNQPYYNELFTNYGFKNYFNQYTYHIPMTPEYLDPVIVENGNRLLNNPSYEFRAIGLKNREKYAEDFVTIFNEAWAKFPGVKPMRKQQASLMFKKMKPLVDPRAIYYAYHEGRPIGFFFMIPDLYQSYKKFNGKFHLVNKLRLLYDLKVAKSFTSLVGLIFGVVPDYQKKGIPNGIIMKFAEQVVKPDFRYTDLEMNWIGDFNPSMMKLAEQIGAKIRKTHITYRYLFDRTKEFKRAKRLS